MCELIWSMWDFTKTDLFDINWWILINSFIPRSGCPPVQLLLLRHLAKQYLVWNHSWKLHSGFEVLRHLDIGETWREQSIHQKLRPCWGLQTKLLRGRGYSVIWTKVMQHYMLSREFLQQRWLYSTSWKRPRVVCPLVVRTRLLNRGYLVLAFWKVMIAVTLKERMLF